MYDAEGLRAEMEENGRISKFVFDGKNVVAEETNEDVIRYIRGDRLVASDSEHARRYYHYVGDELGSVTHVTDENGIVLNCYAYDAFGNCTVSEEKIANRFGYAGEQYDEITQQYYLRARFYNPVIGRFTQEDTYYGDGLNLYEYGRNNPVRYIDPSGHEVRAAAERNYVNRSVDAMNKVADQGVNGMLERVYGDKDSSFSVIYGTDDIANYKYNMIENPGPLADIQGNPAKNFYGGRYNAEILMEDKIYYRGGNSDNALGQWFTTEAPESIVKVRIDTAVKTHWIDPVTGELVGKSVVDTVYAIKIPKGTTVYTGPVASQGAAYCGGYDAIIYKRTMEVKLSNN